MTVQNHPHKHVMIFTAYGGNQRNVQTKYQLVD